MVDHEARLHARIEADWRVIDLASRVLWGVGYEAGLAALVPAWWCDVVEYRWLHALPWARVADMVGYSEHRCWEVASAAMDVCDSWGVLRTMQGVGCAEAPAVAGQAL